MLRLITDFDGPIMDVSERYYQVYQLCLKKTQEPEQVVRVLPKQEFWQLKRAQVGEKEIGKLSGLRGEQLETFAKLRKEIVHTIPYLSYDRPLPGALATLNHIQALGIDLAVMTMRRERELEAAFAQYDLGKYFRSDRRYCLGNDYVKTGDTKDKPLLMAQALKELPPVAATWMVGDTEADIIAAQSWNIKVVAVLSGIRDRQCLEAYHPDYIVPNFAEALELILTPLAATA
jgi:phosphoglycolate phosphatase-like HAD superfamily hydrolase